MESSSSTIENKLPYFYSSILIEVAIILTIYRFQICSIGMIIFAVNEYLWFTIHHQRVLHRPLRVTDAHNFVQLFSISHPGGHPISSRMMTLHDCSSVGCVQNKFIMTVVKLMMSARTLSHSRLDERTHAMWYHANASWFRSHVCENMQHRRRAKLRCIHTTRIGNVACASVVLCVVLLMMYNIQNTLKKRNITN